jgi:integrase
MQVRRIQLDNEYDISFELLDDDDQSIPVVSGFMRHLRARGCSPNTLSAYAYDLLHFMSFLQKQQLTYLEFRPPHALLFLEYLSGLPSRKAARRLGLVLSTTTADGNSATRLSPATINRTFAAVSSFYEYLILADHYTERENPLQKVPDPALARVSERHRPFMGYASHQKPMRRAVHVKMVRRVPRPMDDGQVRQLLESVSNGSSETGEDEIADGTDRGSPSTADPASGERLRDGRAPC